MRKLLILLMLFSTLATASISMNNHDIHTSIDSSYIMIGIGLSSQYKMNLSMGYLGVGSDIGFLVNTKFDIGSGIDDNDMYTGLGRNPFGDENISIDYKSSQLNTGLLYRMYDYLYLNPIIGIGYVEYYNKLRDDTGILGHGDDYYYTPAYSDYYFITGIGIMYKIGNFITLFELEMPFGMTDTSLLVGFNIGYMIGW